MIRRHSLMVAAFGWAAACSGPAQIEPIASSPEVVRASRGMMPIKSLGGSPEFPGEQTVSGWLKTGRGAPDFSLSQDDGFVRINADSETDRYVAIVRRVSAEEFRGDNVKASFGWRAEGFTGELICVLKVQREPDLSYDTVLALDMKKAEGQACDLFAKVPGEANWILFGLTFRGKGTAWLGDPRIVRAPGE